MFSLKLFKPVRIMSTSMRWFRLSKVNPYTENNVRLSSIEADSQKELPVWERVFDHKKYMDHEGPLKMSTGLAFLDVEPFPRLKLMKLYYMLLEELKDIPDHYGYKQIIEELVKFRMEVVDQNKGIRTIENKIAGGIVEELIIDAHSELKLVKLMKSWKPWEYHDDVENAEIKEHMLNITTNNVFHSPNEEFVHDRHERPARPKTGNLNKEDSKE